MAENTGNATTAPSTSSSSTSRSQQQHQQQHGIGSSHNVSESKLVVVKLGSSSICDDTTFFPRLSQLSLLVEDILALRTAGHRVILVSSGAVAMGVRRLGLSKRPKLQAQKQAAAAVGQGQLISLYDDLFSRVGIPIAQVLYTRDNMAQRGEFLSLCNTLRELLRMDIVPIVNENDSVCSQEIRFGDNDTLSAITANMIQATHLFLLTDVDALYTDDPRVNPNAKPLRVVTDIQGLREQITVRTATGSSVGTGGMVTKLIAAEYATSVGCSMVIASGSERNIVSRIMGDISDFERRKNMHQAAISLYQGKTIPTNSKVENSDTTTNQNTFVCSCGCNNSPENPPRFEPKNGTHFLPGEKVYKDREMWILQGLHSYGKVFVDSGAVTALTGSHPRDLLPVGISAIEGNFHAYQCVDLYGPEGSILGTGKHLEAGIGTNIPYECAQLGGKRHVMFGRAVVNHSASEVQVIKGHRTKDLANMLGYADGAFDCVALRNNIAIFTHLRSITSP